jgi:hypothetical protein
MVLTCIPFSTNTNKEEVKIAVAQRTTTDKALRSPTLTFSAMLRQRRIYCKNLKGLILLLINIQ